MNHPSSPRDTALLCAGSAHYSKAAALSAEAFAFRYVNGCPETNQSAKTKRKYLKFQDIAENPANYLKNSPHGSILHFRCKPLYSRFSRFAFAAAQTKASKTLVPEKSSLDPRTISPAVTALCTAFECSFQVCSGHMGYRNSRAHGLQIGACPGKRVRP